MGTGEAGPGRLASLDALRGIAALVVVFRHCALAIDPSGFHHFPFRGGTADPWAWLTRTPLYLLIDGPAAVLIFFALSGLVLALSQTGARRQSVAAFLAKRAIRIWVPFAVAVAGSAGLYALLGGHHPGGYSGWFYAKNWAQPLTPGNLIRQVDIFDGGSTDLDNPMWSLVHEARISLIFPLIFLGAQRAPWALALISIAGLPLAMTARWHGPLHGPLFSQLTQTGSYLFLFAAGAIMAVHIQTLRRGLQHTPRLVRRGLWPLCLVALMLTPGANQGIASWWGVLHLIVPGAAAIVIVGLCTVENIVTRALETPLPHWLGKVSYSLYLLHVPVLLTLAYALPSAPHLLVVIGTMALSLGAAGLFQHYVERSAQRWGRWFAGALSRSTRPRPNPVLDAAREGLLPEEQSRPTGVTAI